MHDQSNSNNGGRKNPPPPPVMPSRDRMIQNAGFRGAEVHRPSRPPGPPQGRERRAPDNSGPLPPGAKTTQSIAKPLSAIFGAGLGVQTPEDTCPGIGRNVPKNTIAPASPQQEDAAERAAQMETRFLRFGGALYRVSEISGENWTNWIAEPALLREKVGKAVEALKGKRADGEGYAADYQMLRAFSKEISNDGRLNEYLLWLKGSEKRFSLMANVYAELSMSPLTPYVEVMDACAAKAGKESDGGLRVFSMMVEDIREYEGTDYNYGELYKKMFDAWYVRKSAEAMVKVYENAGIVQERDSALLRVGELIEGVDSLKAENRRLEEAAKLKSVSPAVMEEVHSQRERLLRIEAENDGLRAGKRKSISTIAELGERLEVRSSEINALKKENASLKESLADERKAGQKLIENIRLLMDRVEAYEKKIVEVEAYGKRAAEMEGRLSVMEKHVEKLQGEKATLARELRLIKEPELAQRETVVSGEFLVPEEVLEKKPEAPAVPKPVLAVPWATPKEDSALVDLRRIAAASMEPGAPAKVAEPILTGMEGEISAAISEVLSTQSEAPAPLFGRMDFDEGADAAVSVGLHATMADEEIGAALDAGIAAAVVEEERVLIEESGSARRDRSDREIATKVSLVAVAEAARMLKVPEPPDETAVVETAGKEPAEITEQIDLEDKSVGYKELGEGRPEAAFWSTKPGKAVKAIFAYGFAGKGTLPARPFAKVVEPEQAYDPLTYDKVMQERELEQSRFLKGMREYNSWYNVAGRWIRARREESISAAHAVSDFYSREKRAVQVVAASAFAVGAIALATVTYLNNAETDKAEQAKMAQVLSRPAVTQVAAPDVDTVADEGLKTVQGGGKKVAEPAPLVRPVLTNVLEKHSLQLDGGTHIPSFYGALGGVTDTQERYVILAGLLGSKENLERYEKRYVDRPVLEMYADFLNTAIDYAQLKGQTPAEKSEVKVLGERVAKRLDSRIQQKRVKEKLGKETAADMRGVAARFSEFANEISLVSSIEEDKPIDIPVVTQEQLERMKDRGEKPATPVIILPEKVDEKPYDVGAALGALISDEEKILDTPQEVNGFSSRAGKAKGDEESFLLHAHLAGQLVENGLQSKMSEKRVLMMHLAAMNAEAKFALGEGRSMTQVAEAVNAFEMSNAEVKRLMAYKKIKAEMGAKEREAIERNVSWMRNRMEEQKSKIDAYEKNKDMAVPLPGSPSVDNRNGAPTAMPGKVQLDRANESIAMQTLVFSEHGLSIMEHPLKVYGQMKGMKLNNFDRYIMMENLAYKIITNPRWMDGLTKAEQFEMLRMLGAYLRSVNRAANEPKNWRGNYNQGDIMIDSLAIEVSELITELRNLGNANIPKAYKHLHFQMDQPTFEELGAATKEFDEQLNYQYKQKNRLGELGQ